MMSKAVRVTVYKLRAHAQKPQSVFSYSHMLVNICRLSQLLSKSAPMKKGLPETNKTKAAELRDD